MPYIEVVANVRVERQVEGYEATLQLSTSAGGRVRCFDQAVVLRETMVRLLNQSGLTDSEIREGGGEASQSTWSPTTSVVHRISIRNKSMDIIMSAMSATERHFAAMPRPRFGGIRHNFEFHTPIPIYATNASADKALRNAIQDARRTADVIANESGYRLGQLISVVELHSEGLVSKAGLSRGYPGDAGFPFDLSDIDAMAEVPYTRLPKYTANASRRFQIRFAAEDGVSGEKDLSMTRDLKS